MNFRLSPGDLPSIMNHLKKISGAMMLVAVTALSASAQDANQAVGDEWLDIAPLLDTEWHQDSPFNSKLKDTSLKAGDSTIALAQMMKHYAFPTAPDNSETLSCTCQSSPTQTRYHNQTLSSSYNWDNIVASINSANTYYIGTLIHDIGATLGLEWGTSTSYAWPGNAIKALCNYFCYPSTMQMVVRNCYTEEAWLRLIYDELRQGRPVYWQGTKTSQKQAFVIDGYRASDGYFHMNFGDLSLENGYYPLPQAMSYDGENYSPTSQYIIIGFSPEPTTKLKAGLLQNSKNPYPMTTSVENGEPIKIHLEALLTAPVQRQFKFALLLTPVEAEGEPVYLDAYVSTTTTGNVFPSSPGTIGNFNLYIRGGDELADGSYTGRIVYQDASSTALGAPLLTDGEGDEQSTDSWMELEPRLDIPDGLELTKDGTTISVAQSTTLPGETTSLSSPTANEGTLRGCRCDIYELTGRRVVAISGSLPVSLEQAAAGLKPGLYIGRETDADGVVIRTRKFSIR